MFSFGLFSSLLPFFVMLLVSAFGVLSHFNSQKHAAKEIAEETEHIGQEELNDNSHYYNPYETDRDKETSAAQAFASTSKYLRNQPESRYLVFSGFFVFNSEEPAGKHIFSRPPPTEYLIV